MRDARCRIDACKGDTIESYTGSRTPADLAEWARAKIADGWTIRVDATTRRFDPVATWHGDLVCEVHLWDCTEAEIRQESYISSGRWRNR